MDGDDSDFDGDDDDGAAESDADELADGAPPALESALAADSDVRPLFEQPSSPTHITSDTTIPTAALNVPLCTITIRTPPVFV